MKTDMYLILLHVCVSTLIICYVRVETKYNEKQ